MSGSGGAHREVIEGVPYAAPPAAAGGTAIGGASSEAPLPPGWKATKAVDGKTYYYHSATKKTQWTHPQPDPAAMPSTSVTATPSSALPAGWSEARLLNGRTYYFVLGGGGKTQWRRPTEPALGFAPPAAAPALVAVPPASAPADEGLNHKSSSHQT